MGEWRIHGYRDGWKDSWKYVGMDGFIYIYIHYTYGRIHGYRDEWMDQ